MDIGSILQKITLSNISNVHILTLSAWVSLTHSLVGEGRGAAAREDELLQRD